jgi:hypothetical protein
VFLISEEVISEVVLQEWARIATILHRSS